MPIVFLMCLAITSGTGCSWTDKSGTHHLLVIGLGVVSVNQTNPTAATVMSTHALGVTASSDGFIAGYSSIFITSVPVGADDVRIEASQRPFAPIKIEVPSAQLINTNHVKKGNE